jgi:hypothetical protein
MPWHVRTSFRREGFKSKDAPVYVFGTRASTACAPRSRCMDSVVAPLSASQRTPPQHPREDPHGFQRSSSSPSAAAAAAAAVDDAGAFLLNQLKPAHGQESGVLVHVGRSDGVQGHQSVVHLALTTTTRRNAQQQHSRGRVRMDAFPALVCWTVCLSAATATATAFYMVEVNQAASR